MVLFDASALVDLFVESVNSRRIKFLIASNTREFVVTDLAAGEFSAGVARLVRIDRMTSEHANAVFGLFDGWRSAETISVAIESDDIRTATGFVRRFELSLKLPDAIHIAAALRMRASLCTFDKTQAAAARKVGLPVVDMA
jgi:uncharacterized protein